MAIDKALIEIFGAGVASILAGLTGLPVLPDQVERGERLLDHIIQGNGPSPQALVGAFASSIAEALREGDITAQALLADAPGLTRVLAAFPPGRTEVAEILDQTVFETRSAAREIVRVMLQRARATRMLHSEGLDEGRAGLVLELLFERLLEGEDYLDAAIPYFGSYVDAGTPRAAFRQPVPDPVPVPPPPAPPAPADIDWDARAKLGRSLEAAEHVARETGTPVGVLAEAVASADARGFDRARLEQQFGNKAKLYVAIANGLHVIDSGGDPVLDRFRSEARVALDEAEFNAVDDLLSGIEARAATNGAGARSNGDLPVAARVRVMRAELEDLRSQHFEAARNYGTAAELAGPGLDRKLRWNLAMSEAASLYSEQDETGDEAVLLIAVDVYTAALDLLRRSESPAEWALNQSNLGNALLRLGENRGEVERLEQAATAFREAIGSTPSNPGPANPGPANPGPANSGPANSGKLGLALLNANLGTALLRVGEIEGLSDAFTGATDAFEKALKGLDRETSRSDWAMVNNNLGTALARTADTSKDIALYDRAVIAFGNALKVYERGDAPGRWSMAKMNLGNALLAIAEERNSTQALEQAVAAYGEALSGMDRMAMPLNWALTQFNLGTALHRLGQSEVGTETLARAVAAYREALSGYTRDSAPMQWAKVHSSVGTVLSELGERTGDVGYLEQAAEAYGATLEEWTKGRAPLQWALSHANLGNTLWAIGEFRRDPDLLRIATNEINAALDIFRAQGQKQYEATALDNLKTLQTDLRRLSRHEPAMRR